MNYIQQAFKGNNEWYYWAFTIVLIFIGWQFIGILPLLGVAIRYSANMSEFEAAVQNNFMTLGIDKNLFLFLMILTFIFGLIALILGVKFIHRRTFRSLVTSRKSVDFKRFWFGFISWGIIALIVIIIEIFLSPENYVWNFNPVPFFTLVVVSCLFLPFQTSFEELLFRGYFMQGLGILVKNRWFPLLLTSVCFGLLHGANPEVEKLGPVSMVFYIGTGFFYGITTLMDEGTELALGLHASNNIVAAFLVTTDWMVFRTDALYVDVSSPAIGIDMYLGVFVVYPVLLVMFSKKYQWKNWKIKLFGKVETPIIHEK